MLLLDGGAVGVLVGGPLWIRLASVAAARRLACRGRFWLSVIETLDACGLWHLRGWWVILAKGAASVVLGEAEAEDVRRSSRK